MPYSLDQKVAKTLETMGHPGAQVRDGILYINETKVSSLSGFITKQKLQKMMDDFNAESPNG